SLVEPGRRSRRDRPASARAANRALSGEGSQDQPIPPQAQAARRRAQAPGMRSVRTRALAWPAAVPRASSPQRRPKRQPTGKPPDPLSELPQPDTELGREEPARL